eukprot:387189_1
MSISVDWIIGVSLAVGANVIGNFGVQIIKIAHRKLDAEHSQQIESSIIGADAIDQKLINDTEHIDTDIIHTDMDTESSETATPYDKKKTGIMSTYLCNPLWICGFLFQLSCSLMDFGALGFAPESVVAPIGALSIVVNLICTPIFQGEKANLRLVIVTFLIVIGSVVTTVFSPKNHNSYTTVNDVIDCYKTIYFISYGIVVGVVLLILWIFHEYCKKLKKNNILYYNKYMLKIHRFSCATLSGTMGAQNILFAKGVSTMIVFTAQNGNNTVCFTLWQFYVILFAMLGSVWFQLKWLNYGLKYFSPMQIIPVFQSFWTLVGILGGLVVYQEFNDFENYLFKILFTVGVVVILTSILYLTTLKSTDLQQQKIDKLAVQQK